MKNTKLSFVLDITDSSYILDKIKDFFKTKYNIDDTIVFSKDPVVCRIPKEYGVLSTFYYRFYKGIVVFFTLEDYLEIDTDDTKIRYLYMDDKTIENLESVNRQMLSNISILSLNKDTNSINEVKQVL